MPVYDSKLPFDQFMDAVEKNIRRFLPETFQDAEVRVSEFRKLNTIYMGLTVQREGQTAVPNINLNELYRGYFQKNMSLEEVYAMAAKQAQLEMPGLQTGWLTDYEQVKSHLFIRVNDAQQNEAFLRMSPNKEVDGMAVTYHIAMEGLHGMQVSTPISQKMMEMYGVTAEQLHEDAIRNAQQMNPPVYNSLTNVMLGISSEMGVDAEMMGVGMIQEGPQIMVLTNEQGMYGAAAMFYPGQMDRIAESLGSDYFVLPSSVHEVLLVPDDGSTDYRDLQMMVQQINASEVAPEERLSDHVYHYDAADHVLEKAETFERRSAEKDLQKAQEKEVSKDPDRKKEAPAGREETARDAERPGRRKSVLQRLNDKKDQVKLQPKKDAPNRARGTVLE